MLLRCYDGVSGSIIILLRSLAFSDFIRTFATMNKNINLKIVWALCGVAILLLFCTQAYWLYNQYQYSLDKTVDQFKPSLIQRRCRRLLLRSAFGITKNI